MAQIDKLKVRIPDESSDAVLNDVLESAMYAILARRYPFQVWPMDENNNYILDARYNDLQLRLAVEMYNRRGIEGESTHSENGYDITFTDYDALLREVIPKGMVL